MAAIGYDVLFGFGSNVWAFCDSPNSDLSSMLTVPLEILL